MLLSTDKKIKEIQDKYEQKIWLHKAAMSNNHHRFGNYIMYCLIYKIEETITVKSKVTYRHLLTWQNYNEKKGQPCFGILHAYYTIHFNIK